MTPSQPPRTPPWSAAGRLLLLSGVLGVAGCTWISAADLKSQQATLDNDGDSFNASEDCDDGDPNINPNATETWYDGVDADCAGDDDYDADGDGYVPDGYGGLATADVPGTGSLPPGDCNDDSGAVHPGLDDAWYDGEDTDCDGADDYDADGDGYVEDGYEGLTTAYADGTGSLPAGDCDDDEPLVNPGITDSPYDGIDADCGGEEDFDADGDGYVPDEYLGRATLYVESSGSLLGGDCDDSAVDVNPGVPEDYYDGIDNDCDPETIEYDQDGDGIPAEAETGGSPDCDDTNPDVNPSAVEVIGDEADSDCDGGSDSFRMGTLADSSGLIEGITWTGPVDARMAADTNVLWLSLASSQVDITTASDTESSYESITAFGIPVAAPTRGPTRILPIHRNPTATDLTLTPGHDLVATGDELFAGFGLMVDGVRQLRLGGWDLDLNTRLGAGAEAALTAEPFTDIHVAMDGSDNPWVVGCDGASGVVQLAAATRAQLVRNQVTVNEELAETSFDPVLCELDFLEGSTDATVSYTDGVGLYTADITAALGGVSFGAPSLLSALDPIDLAIAQGPSDRYIAVADSGGMTYVVDELGATDLLDPTDPASITVSAGDLAGPDLVVGVADEAGAAWLTWGVPGGSWTTIELALPASAASATEVLGWVLPSDTMVVVVITEDDVYYGTVGL